MKCAKQIFYQLNAMQSEVSEDFLVNNIMEDLDPSYCPFIRAIEARNISISYNYLYAPFLSEEAQLKLEMLSIENTIVSSVHYVHTTTPSRGRGG